MSLLNFLKKYLLFRERPSLGLFDLPSYSLAFKLFSLVEVIVILGMGTSKFKRIVKLPEFTKMLFEVLSRKALLSFAVKPLYCALFQVGCVWAEIPSCGCA